MSEEKDPTKTRKKHGRKLLWGILAAGGALVLGLGLLAFVMIGRPVAAPDWVRDRIEARIATALPGIDVNFGQMSLLVQRSGLARVILWDVDIRNARGEQVAQLSDIEAGFSPKALLQGSMELREAQVSGAFLTLQRDPSGRLGLAIGDVFAADTQTPDLASILKRVDQVFDDPRLSKFSSFDADALTVRFEDQRARRGWTADGGRLRLVRENNMLEFSADVALLSGGDGVATVAVSAESEIGKSSVNFGVVLRDLHSRDIATQSPALAWLDDLDAPISGALRSQVGEDGALGVLNATLQIDAGVLQPNRETRALAFDGARTYFTYDPEQALLSFSEIQVKSKLAEITASGQAALEGLDTGWPTGLTGQFQMSGLRLAEGTVLDRDIALSGAELDFKLKLAPFEMQVGALRVTDPDFPITATGTASALRNGWHVALDASATQTDTAHVLAYWPKNFRAPTRQWVSDNIHDGILRDIVFALRLVPDQQPSSYFDFAFSDGHVSFNKHLPAIENGEGRMTMYDGRLGLRLDEGQVSTSQGGQIDLAGSEFVIPNLRVLPTTGEVRLRAKSSVTAALSYINNKSWRVLDKVGRDSSLATGDAQVAGRIVLELREGLEFDDIAIDLSGTMRNVQSDNLVPDRRLRAQELAFSLDNSKVSLAGGVDLDGVAANGAWLQPLRGGRAGSVDAVVDITSANVAALGISLPNGLLTGAGKARLRLDLTNGDSPEFDLSTDLAGLAISVPELGWRLPRNTTGQFEISGRLGRPIQVNGLSLTGGGMNAEADLKLDRNGRFVALDFSTLRLLDWLDVTASIKGRGVNLPPAIEVSSGRIDMRRASFGAGGGSGAATTAASSPVAMAIDQLQVTDSIVLNRFSGKFEVGAGFRGLFNGLLGGSARVSGQVTPRNGGSAFRIEGDDAGDILNAAGILKTVSDGALRLDMVPVVGQPGTYDGTLRIEGTRLRKAPAIGALLDAVSIVGLIDQANGPGIFFSEVDANFRMTPSRIIIKRSSAVGPSMGISLDGFYDLGSGQMDMQGVLSPIYFVNGIGQLISRRGEGLIGFNFNLGGAVSDPRVAVNPLSVFTPGMFRDIFRRPPPQVSQ